MDLRLDTVWYGTGLKLQFAAKNVPWNNTFLVDLIKSNLKAEKKQEKATEKKTSNPAKTNKGRRI